ncbi:MAG: sugar-binding transcriptional regulator [Propioniciclava sp.]
MTDITRTEPNQASTAPLADIGIAARAAWLYYADGLTQAQVASRLFVSRQTVGRLLETAREQGIVRIEFDTHYLSALRTTTRLANQLGLEDVIVVPDDGGHDPVEKRLAVAAASYIRRFLHPGVIVGVGWGATVAGTLSQIPNESLAGVTFASTAGGITSITEALKQNATIAAHLKLLPAPVLVSTAELATQLNAEKAVREVLDLALQASVTLTSVGNAIPASASSVRNALVTAEEVQAFADLGGVGDMIGEWFDAQGQVVHEATSARRIGLTMAQMRELPHVVCVAGGLDKTAAIRGAIAGGIVDVLITDEATATALLTE